MANHSSILAQRSSWTEEPGRLQSMGPQRIRLLPFSMGALQQQFLIRGGHLQMSGDMFACQAGGVVGFNAQRSGSLPLGPEMLDNSLLQQTKNDAAQNVSSAKTEILIILLFLLEKSRNSVVNREPSHTPYRHVHRDKIAKVYLLQIIFNLFYESGQQRCLFLNLNQLFKKLFFKSSSQL